MTFSCRCDNCFLCLGTTEPEKTYCSRCDEVGHARGSISCNRKTMMSSIEMVDRAPSFADLSRGLGNAQRAKESEQ